MTEVQESQGLGLNSGPASAADSLCCGHGQMWGLGTQCTMLGHMAWPCYAPHLISDGILAGKVLSFLS